MPKHPQLIEFLDSIQDSFQNRNLIKLSMSKVSNRTDDLKMIYVTPVELRSGLKFSFKYRFKTRDEVKNYTKDKALELVKELIGNSFMQILLNTNVEEQQLLVNKKGKAKRIVKKHVIDQINLNHNKEKNYLIKSVGNIYLERLGVCDKNGRVKDKQQDKFRQINRYVELMSHWFEKTDHPTTLNIVDMGSGKGYLTFALYDYLKNQLGINVSITGVELRENLVKLCTDISNECGFNDLTFVSKDIREFSAKEIDVIIALHACDTATDLAIYQGIIAEAKLIVCAPCCHKQVRSEMGSTTQFKALTKHGVFEERQAEMLTDTIRSLLMEREGFKTKIFEFISNEHTRKNVMMIGQKTNAKRNRKQLNDNVKQLKESFNIKRHELEDLLSKL